MGLASGFKKVKRWWNKARVEKNMERYRRCSDAYGQVQMALMLWGVAEYGEKSFQEMMMGKNPPNPFELMTKLHSSLKEQGKKLKELGAFDQPKAPEKKEQGQGPMQVVDKDGKIYSEDHK